MEPNVSIIILNWNGWQDTIECLESLYQITFHNYEIIVVDNSSKDESIEKIKEYCKGSIKVESRFFEYDRSNKPIKITEYEREDIETGETVNIKLDLPSNRKLTLIKNEKNYGFAEGNNIGIRYSLNILNADYILLLNNDIVVHKGFLEELLEIGETTEIIGFVGPKIYYYNKYDRIDIINFAGGRLNMLKGQAYHIGVNEIDVGQYDRIAQVDYVEGSCLLVKKEVLKKIGLLDPSYFTYFEETDLCMRGLRAGYKSIYVPKSKIWHKVSSSTKSVTKIYYLTRNMFLFMKVNANSSQYILFLLYFFLYHFIIYSYVCIFRQNDREKFLCFCRGVIDGIAYRNRRSRIAILNKSCLFSKLILY